MGSGRSGIILDASSFRISRLFSIPGLFLSTAVMFLTASSLHAAPPRYDEALNKYRSNDFEGALNVVRSVFDANRGSLELRMLAAACYHRLNNLDSAMAHILYAVKDHPEEAGPALYMADRKSVV